MKIYDSTDEKIISLYNDYLFLKMNLKDYNEEIEKLTLELYYKQHNKIETISTYHCFYSIIEELDIKNTNIIKSHFNPVIYNNFLRISKHFYNYEILNYIEIPYISDFMINVLKKRIIKKLKNEITFF